MAIAKQAAVAMGGFQGAKGAMSPQPELGA